MGGRYRLQERLGTGGAGDVWRAVDERLGAPVAVKLLHDTRPDQAARLAREARELARLAHARIVRCTDCDPEHDPPYLVMELVEGGTLRDRELPLPAAEVRAVLDAMLEALEAAHAAGVTHRDLTPSNVLLDRTGGVVVTDFGLARSGREPRVTASGILVGTPEYWAPEQARGEPPAPPGDLYAAGAIAFELLAGRLPFPSADATDRLLAASRRLVEDAPPLATVVPDAATEDPELVRLVDELLARDPAARPTAAAARRRLAVGQTVRRPGAAVGGAPPSARSPFRRPGVVSRAAVALAVAAGGAALAIAALRDDDGDSTASPAVATGTTGDDPPGSSQPRTQSEQPQTPAKAKAEKAATQPEQPRTVPVADTAPATGPSAAAQVDAWRGELDGAFGHERDRLVRDGWKLVDGKGQGHGNGNGHGKGDEDEDGGGRGLSGAGQDRRSGAVRERALVVIGRLDDLAVPDAAADVQGALVAAEWGVVHALDAGDRDALAGALEQEQAAFDAAYALGA